MSHRRPEPATLQLCQWIGKRPGETRVQLLRPRSTMLPLCGTGRRCFGVHRPCPLLMSLTRPTSEVLLPYPDVVTCRFATSLSTPLTQCRRAPTSLPPRHRPDRGVKAHDGDIDAPTRAARHLKAAAPRRLTEPRTRPRCPKRTWPRSPSNRASAEAGAFHLVPPSDLDAGHERVQHGRPASSDVPIGAWVGQSAHHSLTCTPEIGPPAMYGFATDEGVRSRRRRSTSPRRSSPGCARQRCSSARARRPPRSSLPVTAPQHWRYCRRVARRHCVGVAREAAANLP
jgi:hypothetical protein